MRRPLGGSSRSSRQIKGRVVSNRWPSHLTAPNCSGGNSAATSPCGNWTVTSCCSTTNRILEKPWMSRSRRAAACMPCRRRYRVPAICGKAGGCGAIPGSSRRRSGKSAGNVRRDEGGLLDFGCLAFTPDGTRLVAGTSRNATIFVWRIEDGRLLRKISNTHGVNAAVAMNPKLNCVAVTPDGRRIMSVGQTTKLRRKRS